MKWKRESNGNGGGETSWKGGEEEMFMRCGEKKWGFYFENTCLSSISKWAEDFSAIQQYEVKRKTATNGMKEAGFSGSLW